MPRFARVSRPVVAGSALRPWKPTSSSTPLAWVRFSVLTANMISSSRTLPTESWRCRVRTERPCALMASIHRTCMPRSFLCLLRRSEPVVRSSRSRRAHSSMARTSAPSAPICSTRLRSIEFMSSIPDPQFSPIPVFSRRTWFSPEHVTHRRGLSNYRSVATILTTSHPGLLRTKRLFCRATPTGSSD